MDYSVSIFTATREEVDIPEREVLRYLGYRVAEITEKDLELARVIIPRVREVLAPKAVYGRYPVSVDEDGQIGLPYGVVTSRDLARNLAGCREIFLFAATIGIAFDRLLHTTWLRSAPDAAVMQAAGAAAVEGFVDRLNEELRRQAEREGCRLKPRYSPGFGDYGLDNQRGLFAVLNPSKHIGLSLKDNCIMAPEKSVTAVIGIIGE